MQKLQLALQIAAVAHAGQKRRGSELPYLIHPVGVMMIASQFTTDEDTLCACLLHDVLEDGDPNVYGEAEMLRDFGPEVTEAVKSISKDESLGSWRERNLDYLKRLEQSNSRMAMVVCLADKLHNLGATLDDYEAVGDELWDRFHANKHNVLWWYRSVLELLQRTMPNTKLVDELAEKVEKLEVVVNE